MNIFLKNIGIIRESDIALDGLTVITGRNNSGKTTVGKALYALIDGVSDLDRKVLADRRSYIHHQVIDLGSDLDLLRFYFRNVNPHDEFSLKNSALYYVVYGRYGEGVRRRPIGLNYETLAHQLYEELKGFDIDGFLREVDRFDLRWSARVKDGESSSAAETLQKQIDEAIATLETTFANLEKDPERIQYARESIEQTLLVEFSGQIQPVRDPDAASAIRLTDGGELCFAVESANNKLVRSENPVFFSSPFRRAFLVDDPFVLDRGFFSPTFGRRLRLSGLDETDTVFNSERVEPHNDRLHRVLRAKQESSILERTLIDDALGAIREKMNAVLPGSLEFSDDGDFYVQGGAKLQISNLATGSKMFSIIKLLLDRGLLDRWTMLILDEPESHLHPQWQNAFAEIIVLLAKELGVRVLMTTHSPNFMLAIDANMRKYDFAAQTNFYQTRALDGGFVEYQCVNDNLETIYADFLQYLSDVRRLRDAYLTGAEGEP